jgi:hypothetical protein
LDATSEALSGEGFLRVCKHRYSPWIAQPFLTALLLCATALHAEKIPLTDLSRLELRNTRADTVTYRGRRALKLTEQPAEAGLLAIFRNHSFHDGTIDIDVAGALSATAAETDRGFIGIAFRMQSDNEHYECIYIRPTNGRALDQLRRNHSTQYESLPDWPWYRLRKESPGVYESYADMAEGEWIHMKVVVHGAIAALYLGGSAQPCLLINDLKLGDTQGTIALWGGSGTVGYFSNLKISEGE